MLEIRDRDKIPSTIETRGKYCFRVLPGYDYVAHVTSNAGCAILFRERLHFFVFSGSFLTARSLIKNCFWTLKPGVEVKDIPNILFV